MKFKTHYLIGIICFIIGFMSPLLYLTKYFQVTEGRTLEVKKFPSWAKTVIYKNNNYDAAITTMGCVINGKSADFKYIHILDTKDGIVIFYDGKEDLKKSNPIDE